MFHNPHYLIGCPVWACEAWRGSVFPRNAPRGTWLGSYSRCFNCVEGNSTFYGIPTESTFQKWADQASAGFQFCLKFPRSISHEAELKGADDQLKLFLKGLEILAKADRLGPTFLQLGPSFDQSGFARLANFLDQLPGEYPYAVEVRHPDWFESDVQSRFYDLLEERQVDRVIFDSRALFVAEARDEYEVKSRKRKPRVPIRTRVTGSSPMLRLIGRNDVDAQEVTDAIEEWSELAALWIAKGLRPIVFTHSPDDTFAPMFARRFHNRLADRLKELQSEDSNKALEKVERWEFEPAETQQSLFD